MPCDHPDGSVPNPPVLKPNAFLWIAGTASVCVASVEQRHRSLRQLRQESFTLHLSAASSRSYASVWVRL